MNFEPIKQKYVAHYPHLRWIATERGAFAKAAILLAAPQTVSAQDVYALSVLAA